ncbi:MAG: RNase adapter RapZ [Xanthomonadales bacterium]|nr:RNase adapter RapZ [Xanthomonadales bacterium]
MDNVTQDIIIVSGMSGGGKSTALNALEDLGYYCIDNLPGAMLPGFGPQISANPDLYKKVALGIDARSRESDLKVIIDWMCLLRETGFNCRLLFVTAEKSVLIKRFSETRRRHPLTGSDQVLPDAIDNEARLLEPLQRCSDQVIDSSHTNIHQLRRQVWNFVDRRSSDMTIVLQSFAYKQGVPQDADFIFDARVLPNPYWQDDLRTLTGKDKAVSSWLEGDAQVIQMSRDIEDFMHVWLPAFQQAQRSYVTICIGCTGGKHRSVFLAETLAKSLGKNLENVLVHHREEPFWNKP